jgi:hypothetical protein
MVRCVYREYIEYGSPLHYPDAFIAHQWRRQVRQPGHRHQRREAHKKKIDAGEARPGSADIPAGVLHFLGEIEVVFGLWTIPLVVANAFFEYRRYRRP